jgi:formate hydrogenlyase subunit 6/NADH:ubiquinone oxidoreductase subunit I
MKTGDMPIIDEVKCTHCGLCVSVCSCDALIIEDNVVKAVKAGDPGWCTMCELVCPTGAITCPFEIVFEDEDKK